MKIIVGGYIIGFPLGGMTWHHLNYLLGFHALGHEVVFLEDSGQYYKPYQPLNWSDTIDSTYGREYLTRTFARYGLNIPWCYYSEFEDRHYGLSREALDDHLRSADLMICVSGITPLRDDRPRPRRTCVIDTDPVFTQLRMRHDAHFVDYFRQFNSVATFGRLIGTSQSPLPTHGFNWIPTNQPVALDHWPVHPVPSRNFTTIGKWEHATARDMTFDDKTYRSSKRVEWDRLIDLPAQSPFPLGFGMAGMDDAVQRDYASRGWQLHDAERATISCESFQHFIQQSAGELTVAKQIYAGLPSGWFSDRSACYLASGRPVVTQASGFDQWLPTGDGLFSFSTPEEALAALRSIASDYPAHARSARRIAERHFDASVVLSQLLSEVA